MSLNQIEPQLPFQSVVCRERTHPKFMTEIILPVMEKKSYLKKVAKETTLYAPPLPLYAHTSKAFQHFPCCVALLFTGINLRRL